MGQIIVTGIVKYWKQGKCFFRILLMHKYLDRKSDNLKRWHSICTRLIKNIHDK